jgi:ATP-dependent Clp protease protease subunit
MGRGDYTEDRRILVSRMGRTIYFFDEINSDSVCETIKLLHQIETEAKNKPIEIVISSVGGDVYDGLGLYDKIRQSQCEIITVGTGLVASMAVIIYLAGDRRSITENTRFMVHQAKGWAEGKPTELIVDAKEIGNLEEITLDIVAERTGQSIKKLRNEIKVSNKYLTAEQCIDEGYAHELIINKRTRRRKKTSSRRK